MGDTRLLERQIAARPNDPEPYTVLGDQLQSAGDPLGELVAIQDARRIKPKRKTLADREAAFVKQHAARLFGELAPILTRRLRKRDERPITIEWFQGFIRAVRLHCVDADTTVARVLPALCTLPAARFLQELRFGSPEPFETNSNPDYAHVIDVIASIELPRTLTSIVFGDVDPDNEPGWNTIGDLERLYARVPKLEKLRIFSAGANLATSVDLGAFALPKLRSFELETDYVDAPKVLAQIAGGRARSLERLAISFGINPHEEATLADVAPFLDGKLPKLSSLAFEWLDFGPAFVEALVRSRLAKQLVHLGLTSCHLHDESIDLLLANKAKLPRLASIDVGLNYITKPAIRRLQTLCDEVVVDTQWPPGEDYLR